MGQKSRRKDVPLDNVLLCQILERPGIRQNALVELNLGDFCDSYTRYRLVYLEKTGRIERRRTGARCVECYPVDPVLLLERLILMHWEKIEPDGEKIASEEKFKRLEWVLERYGILLKQALGREIASDELRSLLDRLLGIYDIIPGSDAPESLEFLFEFYWRRFGDGRGETEP